MGLFTPNIDRLDKNDDMQGLLKCLKHRKSDIRLAAFIAILNKTEDPDIIQKLKVLQDDKDTKLKTLAVLKFAQFGEKGLFEKLRPIIIDGSTNEKIEALRIIADRGFVDNDDITNLVVLALNDKKALVQIESIKVMGILKSPLFVLHLDEMMHDKRHNMRVESARALGMIANEEATETLIGALMDSHADVRKAARDSLETIGSEIATRALNDAPFMLLVKKMNESVASREETIRHIGKHKLKEGLPLIKQACRDEYKNVRLEAVRVIGIMRDKSSMGIVIKMIDDPYYDIRLEAVKTLEKMNDNLALAAIEKAMSDYNTNVRKEAQKAYYSLKARLELLNNK
ncbi:MAG: HEAT repeat domain-containing protein [Spirochaetes bacterium]|jgi:HEAT repeat protein|nr:HEAT repeat domain-containing protein [Spirochaetota bacterium]